MNQFEGQEKVQLPTIAEVRAKVTADGIPATYEWLHGLARKVDETWDGQGWEGETSIGGLLEEVGMLEGTFDGEEYPHTELPEDHFDKKD